MAEVFSSGGGTQSACTAALIVAGKLPKPDFSLIVDTERERPAVWDYHDKVIVPALQSIGIEIVRIKRSDFATHDLWCGADLQSVIIPAFSSQTNDTAKLTNYCTTEWKIRVSQRWLRSQGVPTRLQRKWICFSSDEIRRVLRMERGKDFKAGLIRFPLVYDVPMRREQSIRFVMQEMGWPEPPRSACWMCPNATDAEWVDLRDNYPEAFARAVALERELQVRDPFAFLHRSCVPLDQVIFRPQIVKGGDDEVRGCDSGHCFT